MTWPRGVRMGVVLLSACAAALLARDRDDDARDRSTGLVRALGERGITAAPGDVVWIDPPRGVLGTLGASSRATVRGATAAGEPNDLFLVDAELSPEGVLLGVRGVHNLTETSGADESRPVVRGQTMAYVAQPWIEGASPTVHVLDLSGQPVPEGTGWTRIERVQHAITNLQTTGRLGGIGARTFAIEADKVTIDLQDGAVLIRAGEREAKIPVAADRLGSASAGDGAAPLPPWIRADNAEAARPGNLVTWAVDRVRTEIGDERMQLIKDVFFTAKGVFDEQVEAVTGDTGAEAIAADLGKNDLDPPVRQIPVDPEIGWPPPPLEPWVTPAMPEEGEWHPQGGDAFVRKLDGLPPAFLTTFLRTDRSRKVTRVYVVLWDPRQVELHMMAGTVEPKGATGEAGPGIIPRTPEVMKRVVAASNAGFQALHGEFGMMADGVVYLPPKPYAATVAVRRDGSTVFGTWSEDPRIPDWMVSYRQNMTVMVQDQKFNPYGRTWWGGTVPGSEDKTHTVRTGICLTKERFVAYFYGADISPDALQQAMIQARCAYGIALDMNAGHSGLEFYHVAPEAELPALGRPLQHDWEAEGEVSGLDGWRFRGRRLIRGMGLMNFPRYIRREARDFFYMTLRNILPGPNLTPAVSPAEPGEGEWRVKGLPQHGFPYALAVTELRPDASRRDVRLRALKIDPRAVRPAAGDAGRDPTIVVLGDGSAAAPAAQGGDVISLWHAGGVFSLAATSPQNDAVRLATGRTSDAGAVAALGIEDEGGMLLYAELAGNAPDAALLDDFLKRAGCSSRLLLPRRLPLALGGDTDLAGAAVHPPSGPGVVRLTRAESPGAGRMFESTPVVPFNVWYPLQQKRIRYFRKPASEAEDADTK